MPPETKIKFVGGPFDGHWEFVNRRPARLAHTIALPVSRDILWLLSRQRQLQRKGPITSNAIYELRQALTGWSYRYIESRPPVETQASGVIRLQDNTNSSWITRHVNNSSTPVGFTPTPFVI